MLIFCVLNFVIYNEMVSFGNFKKMEGMRSTVGTMIYFAIEKQLPY